MGLEKPLGKLGYCLSAETHARMEFAMEAHEGPTTQDGTGHLVAVSRLLFEGHHGHLSSTCYAEDVAETSSNQQCAFRQLWKKYGGVYIGRGTHVHCVFPRGPRGSKRSRQS